MVLLDGYLAGLWLYNRDRFVTFQMKGTDVRRPLYYMVLPPSECEKVFDRVVMAWVYLWVVDHVVSTIGRVGAASMEPKIPARFSGQREVSGVEKWISRREHCKTNLGYSSPW